MTVQRFQLVDIVHTGFELTEIMLLIHQEFCPLRELRLELGAVVITQEALYALTLGCSMLWRACTNSNNSAVDRVLQQEIDRLSNRKCVPDARSSAHAAQQISSHTAAAEQVKSVPVYAYSDFAQSSLSYALARKASMDTAGCRARQATSGKPIAQHISPATVKKMDNIADKARAVVSHVTHEQMVQTIYASIAEREKTASRELLNDVAIDWHKQIKHSFNESIRSTRACAHNNLQGQIQEWTPRCTSEIHPNGGITLYTPNPICSLYLGPSRQRHTHTLADDISEQRLNEQIQIACDPVSRAVIRNELHAFIKNAYNLLYGTLLERIAALVHLTDFHIKITRFGQPLYDVQKEIYAKYVCTDGSICIDRLSDMSDAHTIFKKYITRPKKIAPLFEKPCQRVRLRNNTQLIKKASKVDLQTIRNNRTNQCYRKMLAAFANGDMQQVEQIKRTNAQLQGVTTLYNALKAEYDKAIQQQEALLKDAYGIAHFVLPIERQDPVYTALSDHNRAQLQSNSSALVSFNDTLKLRQLYNINKHCTKRGIFLPTLRQLFIKRSML